MALVEHLCAKHACLTHGTTQEPSPGWHGAEPAGIEGSDLQSRPVWCRRKGDGGETGLPPAEPGPCVTRGQLCSAELCSADQGL